MRSAGCGTVSTCLRGRWRARRSGWADASVSAPIWSGRVINMSAGGVYVRADLEAARYIEVGDLIGIRVSFGGEMSESIVMDATFRHAERDGDMVLLGFQFVEGDFSPETVHAIAEIRKTLAPFQ